MCCTPGAAPRPQARTDAVAPGASPPCPCLQKDRGTPGTAHPSRHRPCSHVPARRDGMKKSSYSGEPPSRLCLCVCTGERKRLKLQVFTCTIAPGCERSAAVSVCINKWKRLKKQSKTLRGTEFQAEPALETRTLLSPVPARDISPMAA